MTATVFLGELPFEVAAWLKRRRALDQERHDEVWDGRCHVVPMAHARHGDVGAQLAELLGPRARRAGLRPVSEMNVGPTGRSALLDLGETTLHGEIDGPPA